MSVALAGRAPHPAQVQQRRCGRCGKVTSRSAYACRRCGRAQRIRPRTLFLFLAAGLMAGMFVVASAGALEPQAHPAEAPTAKATAVEELPELHGPAAAGPTTEVSASDLWASYFRDAAGADRLYRDRSLLVTGDIRALEHNYQGEMVVRLSAGHAFDTVNATLRAGNEQIVGALSKGHAVSLLCVGRGAVMGAPLLAGCLVR